MFPVPVDHPIPMTPPTLPRRWMAMLLLFSIFLALTAAGFAADSDKNTITINLGGGPDSQPNLRLPGFNITLAGPPWLQATETLILVSLFLWSLVWICGDASRRGKSAFWAFVFAFAACYPLS